MFVRRKIASLMPELKAYAIALSQNLDEAEDLVQDAFQKALGSKKTPSKISDLKPWMFRIIRNQYIDQKRKEKTRLEYSEEVIRLYSDEPSHTPAIMEEILVRQALTKVTTQEREILYLVDVLGLKYAEAAIVLGIPSGTVMSRLSRARKSLLDEVEQTNITPLHQMSKSNGSE
ncbi:sigma-70 family RNA polymerase sigma factor [Sneathiella sp. P13V-1]|nr:sigma-70 family RNA polymerase sigma factor [Sneathiella sp. P13V-1]